MSSAASTQETELDTLFLSYRLDNILQDAFALGAVPTAPTGHLADLYQFLACDPPAPLVLPTTNLSIFFHNELQNNCGPLNPSDSKLLSRIFKNSYRPDNESLRALTLLDTSTTDHVYLYNTMNRSVTTTVEQLVIGLTQQLGLSTFTRSHPIPNADYYPTFYAQRQRSQDPTHPTNKTSPEPTVEREDSLPPPPPYPPPVRRSQNTPRYSTEKGRKTRSNRELESTPSNQARPKERNSKTSKRAEILPEDKVPVSMHVKRGVNKIGLRRKSCTNPSLEAASGDLQFQQPTQPSEKSVLDMNRASEPRYISESETESSTEIGGNISPMDVTAATDGSRKDGRRGRAVLEDESHEYPDTAKKPRLSILKNPDHENTAAEDKEDMDDAMSEDENDGLVDDSNDAMFVDENDGLVEDTNDPVDEDQSGSTANAHNDGPSDMASIPTYSIAPSKPSEEATPDNATFASPSEVGNETPFEVPISKSVKEKTSKSTPSTEDTPSITQCISLSELPEDAIPESATTPSEISNATPFKIPKSTSSKENASKSTPITEETMPSSTRRSTRKHCISPPNNTTNDSAITTSPSNISNTTPFKIPKSKSSIIKASKPTLSTEDTPSITRRSTRKQCISPPNDATHDSATTNTTPSEISINTPFRIPKSKPAIKNASKSTPSKEDTPQSITRRSTRKQCISPPNDATLDSTTTNTIPSEISINTPFKIPKPKSSLKKATKSTGSPEDTPFITRISTRNQSSDDATYDSTTTTSSSSSPSKIGNKTPFRSPKSTKKASGSTPSTEGTTSITRRSTRNQATATSSSEPCAAASKNIVSESITETTPSKSPLYLFKCVVDGCGKVYSGLKRIERHHNEAHENLKPHPCPFKGCRETFPRAERLNAHIATHDKALKTKGR